MIRLATSAALFAALAILLPLISNDTHAADEKPGPRVIAQGEDGSILLRARWVTIHGTTVRYEPQPHKDTIGYWTKVEDWVSWDFTISKPGKFRVDILQGCGKGSGGSTVDFECAGQTLAVTVEETGGFQDFKKREIGIITLEKAGPFTLSVKPKTKPGAAVMDLRQVVLTPVAEE